MGNKVDEGFNHSLSRKELQSLCKKYGLPANRSSSEMAKSLASFLENQRLGSITAGERLCGIQEAGRPLPPQLQLQPGALNSFRDAGKDCYGLVSYPIDRYNGGNYSQTVKCNAVGCCAGNKCYEKDGYGGSIYFQQTSQSQFVSQYDDTGFKNTELPTMCFNRNCLSLTRDERMNNVPPQNEHRHKNVGTCSNETAFPSSIKPPTTIFPSSFQFHVSSDEGINLYVDLNSNPSEWVEKLKSEVSVCSNMSNIKSRTFHTELGRFGESSKQMKSSFQLNSDAEKIKDVHEHTGLAPNLIIKESNQLSLDHPDGDNGYLGSTGMTPCDRAVDVSEHLEGDQGLTLNKAQPDSQNQIISGGASFAKDRCLINLDSKGDSSGEKSANGAVINILDGPLNILAMEHQNSKLENKECENSTLQIACNLAGGSGRIPGCLPDGSLWIQTPKDVLHNKDTLQSPREVEFVDLVDSEHNIYVERGGHAVSTELDQETCRNRLPTLVEEQGTSKIINGGEISECSEDELHEMICRDDVKSNGFGKKRAYVDGDQNDCSMLDAKTSGITATEHLTGDVLPRRSMRLVSK